MRTFHKTIFTPAVEIKGAAGQGYAIATENAIDTAIDSALDKISGHFRAFNVRLKSVTHSPVKFGDTTFLVVTIVAEESPHDHGSGWATPRWEHKTNEEIRKEVEEWTTESDK